MTFTGISDTLSDTFFTKILLTAISDHINRFLNPCLFDGNKWHFNRCLNVCLSRFPAWSQWEISYEYQVPHRPFLPFPLYLDTAELPFDTELLNTSSFWDPLDDSSPHPRPRHLTRPIHFLSHRRPPLRRVHFHFLTQIPPHPPNVLLVSPHSMIRNWVLCWCWGI
jgi:hypothetical protein